METLGQNLPRQTPEPKPVRREKFQPARRYGPHPKLKQIRNEFLLLIQKGHTKTTAAQVVGITPRTIHRWLRKGRESGDDEYVAFVADFATARARYIDANLELLNRAATGIDVTVRKRQRERMLVDVLDEDGNPVIDPATQKPKQEYAMVVVADEEVEKTEFYPEYAKFVLQSKEREEWGPDAKEIAELKKAFQDLIRRYEELTQPKVDE